MHSNSFSPPNPIKQVLSSFPSSVWKNWGTESKARWRRARIKAWELWLQSPTSSSPHHHTMLHAPPPHLCWTGECPLPREAWLRRAPISKPFWVCVRCGYTVWFLGRLWKRSNWTQAHTCRINESPALTIAVLARLFLRYLWGFVRAPAVLVTTETRQQNIFISIHLAKPQCLLCVITDHKMAEDQLLYLRAFVLKEKEYESQRASD